jgi:DNA-binding response OmpR family regulator/DNA-binding CsgD family transcriptional regulator
MSGYTILVAEDEPSILIHTSETLEKSGYFIMKAVNGKEAVNLLNEKRADLIILDWSMPVMDGMEALLHIKSDPVTAAIPVIFLTGQMTSRENLSKAFEAGVTDFIKKPFDKSELLARVNSVFKTVEYHRREITAKDRELASVALNIAHNSEINQLLVSRLDQIKELARKNSYELMPVINDLIEDVSVIKQTHNWERFSDHFTMIYPAYVKSISAVHPGLSPSDMKLCMLLRLNISTKDIAAITCLTYDSIRVSRTRLRKKLGLHGEAGLVSYLLQF